jgi:hypothetical protein
MSLMNSLDRLEKWAQWLIEGPFQRLLHKRLYFSDTQSRPVSEAKTEAERWSLRLISGELFGLGQPVVRLGHAADNDLVLKDPSVAAYHAQLRWQQGSYHLYPADGLATTKLEPGPSPVLGLNHRPLLHPARLAAQDIINLGGLSLTVVRRRATISRHR